MAGEEQDTLNSSSSKCISISSIVVRFRVSVPCGLVVRIRRSHRRGRGSIPRMGVLFFFLLTLCLFFLPSLFHSVPYFLLIKVEAAPLNPEKGSSRPQHTKELEQLDALLSKAQKLRIQTKPEEEKMTKRSMRAASSAYKAGSQDDKLHNRMKTAQSSRTDHSRRKPGYTASKNLGPKRSPSVSSKLQPGHKEDRGLHSQAVSKEEEVMSEPLRQAAQGFSLAKKG